MAIGNLVQVWNGNMVKILTSIHSENFDETMKAKIDSIKKETTLLKLKTMDFHFCKFLDTFAYLTINLDKNNTSYFESLLKVNVMGYTNNEYSI